MGLVEVQRGIMLDSSTAPAWLAVEADARREDKVDLNITRPAGGWRSEAMVVDMYDSTPDRRRDVYGVPVGTGVAKPRSLGGNGSVHQSGRCVDVGNWRAIGAKRLHELAARHGGVATIGTEPWHIEFRGGAGGFTPINNQEDEVLIRTKQHGCYTATPGAVVSHPSVDFVNGIETLGVKVIDVAPADLALWLFNASGVPANRIPAPGYAWYASVEYDKGSGGVGYTLEQIAYAVADEQAKRLAE